MWDCDILLWDDDFFTGSPSGTLCDCVYKSARGRERDRERERVRITLEFSV